jgi:hypothetical protein
MEVGPRVVGIRLGHCRYGHCDNKIGGSMGVQA